MKKIKILMLHLNYGGVEKQTITMANELVNKYDIEIVSFYKMSDKPAYNIDKRIKINYLYNNLPNREEFKSALKHFKIIKTFKEGIKAIKTLYNKKKLVKKEILKNDADIYFSTRTEYGKLLSKYSNKSKLKLTQEHNFFDDDKYIKEIVNGYKNLDYVVVISKYHEDMYNEWFKNTNVKIVRIENILEEKQTKTSKLNNNAIIAVGRFNYIKDFLSLIEVMKYNVIDNPKLKLYLLGDGEEKAIIENKIKEYKLENNVVMPGFVSSKEVKEYELKSDLYIMTSLRECFPMVLLEAYNCGLPVISFDILTGPREIVKNNKTGYLIKDRNCKLMAQKINELLKDKNKMKEFSNNALKEAKKYTKESIMPKWYDLFK